jgi:hypothetical protein
MNPPIHSQLPSWVAPFCCVAPFFALIGFAIAGICGAAVGSPGLICLILLCGKTTGWVLQVPTTHPAKLQSRIETGT